MGGRGWATPFFPVYFQVGAAYVTEARGVVCVASYPIKLYGILSAWRVRSIFNRAQLKVEKWATGGRTIFVAVTQVPWRVLASLIIGTRSFQIMSEMANLAYGP